MRSGFYSHHEFQMWCAGMKRRLKLLDMALAGDPKGIEAVQSISKKSTTQIRLNGVDCPASMLAYVKARDWPEEDGIGDGEIY